MLQIVGYNAYTTSNPPLCGFFRFEVRGGPEQVRQFVNRVIARRPEPWRLGGRLSYSGNGYLSVTFLVSSSRGPLVGS